MTGVLGTVKLPMFTLFCRTGPLGVSGPPKCMGEFMTRPLPFICPV